MRKVLCTALCLSSLWVFQACDRDESSSINEQEAKVILNTDAATLANRLGHAHSGVLDLQTGAASGRSPLDGNSENFPMSLLAEVSPPVYNGFTLKATHVDVQNNYVYVSYNTQGDMYLGGIDVIDISSPDNPQLIIQAILPNTDISTVVYKNGDLFIAGAVDMDSDAALTSPAFVAKMPLQSGLLTDGYTAVSLLGNVATGLAVADSNFYAVTGSNGIVASIDLATNVVETTIPVADLRAVGKIANKIVVLSGSDGVKVYNAENLNLQSSFTVSADVAEAKRTIDFQGDNLITAEGYSGAKVYNLNSGGLVQTLALPTAVPDVDAADVVTNAVSVNGDYVYVANGAAGVSVYKKQDGAISLLGAIQMGGSANYVKSVGDYIFVADGTGGLKIVKKVPLSAIDCTDFPSYAGGQWLNVNSNETMNYQGAAALQGINVNANLTWCGALSVTQGLNVNTNGVFTIKGSLAQGQYNGGSALIVNGTMKIEGTVVVYGNLILNSGAHLEFLGSNSAITIYGNVTQNSNVTITGTFTDTLDKLN